MLNIIKSKLNNTYNKKSLENYKVYNNKDIIPVVRNWKSSIYVYNKNATSLISIKSKYVMKLIKGYFNSYHLELESLVRKRKKMLLRRYRKMSSNKIFISDGEFKHTNDKVNITLYVYNRQKLNYLIKLENKYNKLLKKSSLSKRLKFIKSVGLNILQQQKSTKLINVLPKYNSEIHSIQNIFYKRFIKKSLKMLKYYLFYKQIIYINKAKFENSYLQGLINLIKKIFNKNVEFNIINLKYLNFNSKILTQPLELKIRRKRKVPAYLKFLIDNAKIKKIKLIKKSKKFFTINNFDTNNLINDLMQQDKTNTKYLNKIILNNIKYKKISGIRLEVAGRLSKRFTATRSQRRTKHKGQLKNIYSSVLGGSTPMIRKNYKPNIQHSVINSTSRVGAFGVKGWISSI